MSQTGHPDWLGSYQQALSQLKSEKMHAIIVTGDYKCRSSQWWPGDTEQPEGNDLAKCIETNNVYQVINEPTNSRDDTISCIDLTMTVQPAYVIETGGSQSLDNHCQHQRVFGNLNIACPFPPPYRRTVWEYCKANVANIKYILSGYTWHDCFKTLGCDEMVEKCYGILKPILYKCIPNKVIKCNDKDPPWISHEAKRAIKRKHRIYKKFVLRGRKANDWSYVQEVWKSTSTLAARATENYYQTLGRKLLSPALAQRHFGRHSVS